MFDLALLQTALRDFGIDGWLLYDFRGSNLLARRILDLDQKPVTTRRFFYLVPAQGRRASWSIASRPACSIICPARRRSTCAGKSSKRASPSF